MSKQRLEAFTDGIIAIIITIMVLSIPLPQSFEQKELWGLVSSIFIYLISFVVVGGFWNQHHRIFIYIQHVDHKIIASNFCFLFFLSLIPLFTKWVIENQGSLLPAIGYDIIYLLVSFCYMFIFRLIMQNSENQELRKIIDEIETAKKTRYNKKILLLPLLITSVFVALIIVLSFFMPRLSIVILMGIPVVSSLFNIFVNDRVSQMIKKTQK